MIFKFTIDFPFKTEFRVGEFESLDDKARTWARCEGLEIIMDKIEEELSSNYDKYVKIEPRPDEKESDYEGE